MDASARLASSIELNSTQTTSAALEEQADKESHPLYDDANTRSIYVFNPRVEMIERQRYLPPDIQKQGYNSIIRYYISYFFCCMERSRFEQVTTTSSNQSTLYIHRSQVRLASMSMVTSILALCSALGFTILSNIFSLEIPHSIVMACLSLIVLTSTIVLLYLFIQSKCGNNSRSVNESLNVLFGIPYPSDLSHSGNDINSLFDLDRRGWGLWFLLSLLVSALNNLIIFVFFPITNEEWNNCGVITDDKALNDLCAINASDVSVGYVFSIALVVSANSFYRVNPVYTRQFNGYFDGSSETSLALTGKIRHLRDLTQRKMKTDWRHSEELQMMRLLASIAFHIVVSLGFHFVIIGFMYHDLYNGALYSSGCVLFCSYLYVAESSIISYFIYCFFEILYHSQFPTSVLVSMSRQFGAENVQDVLAWWQLREYYLQCIINVYGTRITASVGASLSMFFIAFVFAISMIRQDEELEGTKHLVMSIMFTISAIGMCATLLFTSFCVNMYTAQLAHVHTLSKEKMRLKYLGKYKQDNTILDEIMTDVAKNSQPMKVFGVKMNQEFLLALKSTAVAVTLAAVFS